MEADPPALGVPRAREAQGHRSPQPETRCPRRCPPARAGSERF